MSGQSAGCTVMQVVMSPHVYPPSITRNTFLGQTLWQQCAIAFGYLENRGYCRWPGQCRHFPIIIGETGSFLHDELDRQWMQVRPPGPAWGAGRARLQATLNKKCRDRCQAIKQHALVSGHDSCGACRQPALMCLPAAPTTWRNLTRMLSWSNPIYRISLTMSKAEVAHAPTHLRQWLDGFGGGEFCADPGPIALSSSHRVSAVCHYFAAQFFVSSMQMQHAYLYGLCYLVHI
jgi:hypothetical protein